jgi:hypothetical protein
MFNPPTKQQWSTGFTIHRWMAEKWGWVKTYEITIVGGRTILSPAILGCHPDTRVLTHNQISKMRSAGQSDGRRWCASATRDLDLHFWHGMSSFPPWYVAFFTLKDAGFATKRTQRVVKYMVFVRCFIYVFTEGHMFGTFWLDTCLLSAKLQQPRSTWQNEESTKRQDWKINSAGPFFWTLLDIKPCNTICFPWTGHIFVGEIPLLWLTSQDGYGRLPDLNLPEKLFWEQPEPRSLGGLRVLWKTPWRWEMVILE